MLAKLVPLLLPLNEPVAPEPIRGNIDKVVNWVTWIGLMICVLGIIIAGSMMAVGARRGDAGETAGKLGWVIAGCIVIGAASGLIKALVNFN